MEIDPYLQFTLLLSAFLTGIAQGGLWEVLTASRILFGAYRPPEWMRERYARPLPLVHRAVPFEKKGIGRNAWRGIVVALGDCLFCLWFAVTVILLLYRYNDGAFRFSVPLLALGGFALFRTASVRIFSRMVAYMAYGFAALALYLRVLLSLPPRGVCYLTKRFVVHPVGRLYRRTVLRRAQRASVLLCRAQIAWAKTGFTGELPRIKDEKKKERMRHGKKEDRGKDHPGPVGDPHPHSGHIRCSTRHRRQSTDGVESAPPSGRRAARAKRRSDGR
ncbi:MAG: spore cortex biosynthesis protein YabQ [Clostridia bacterium]|nr:spore cortex biosynthesis protein YabQ [Clostridia bacterium]